MDHEHIFDSDSILSLVYLPKSLVVLGGGVIASEYASIFAALGVDVTMIDKYPRPLGFLDADLTDTFVQGFSANGGKFRGDTEVSRVYWHGVANVVVECADGRSLKSEKLLCAAGRIANVSGLNIEAAGLELNERGLIAVDEQLRTKVPNIYAAGDVIGPPSLASASMEQGRRASCNALGIELGEMNQMIPAGIYAIPELSSVGLSEQQAQKKYGDIIVGRANFEEAARGQINGIRDGMLKIVLRWRRQKSSGGGDCRRGCYRTGAYWPDGTACQCRCGYFCREYFQFPHSGGSLPSGSVGGNRPAQSAGGRISLIIASCSKSDRV